MFNILFINFIFKMFNINISSFNVKIKKYFSISFKKYNKYLIIIIFLVFILFYIIFIAFFFIR